MNDIKSPRKERADHSSTLMALVCSRRSSSFSGLNILNCEPRNVAFDLQICRGGVTTLLQPRLNAIIMSINKTEEKDGDGWSHL